MNYIVFDLEWNMVEKNELAEQKEKELQFEIIELGAVKVNELGEILDTYSQLIKPQISQELHFIISKLVHVDMDELDKGITFKEMINEFLVWCGEDYMFATWGPIDLMELQKNMDFYEIEPLSDRPIAYLDVQKLFSLDKEDGKLRRNLESAVDILEIPKDISFHRASSDAYYTAKILGKLNQHILNRVSYDVYRVPRSRQEEVYVEFSNYSKYITRVFESKQEALEDNRVLALKWGVRT